MGIPLSVVSSPLGYGALLVGHDLVNLVIPTPDLFYLLAHADQNPALHQSSQSTGPVGPALALVIPGMVVMALAWLGTRRSFAELVRRGLFVRSAQGSHAPGISKNSSSPTWLRRMAIAAGIGVRITSNGCGVQF